MNIITEDLVDNMVHDICAQLSSAGIKLNADLLSDLNENIKDWLVDECEIEVQEAVTFAELSHTQKTAWQDLANKNKISVNELYTSLKGEMRCQSTANDSAKQSFKLIDETSDGSNDINGFIDNSDYLGLAVHINGYGDCYSKDGQGTPIFIEKYDNKLRAIVYSDINIQEPTHVICLEKAKNDNRQDIVHYDLAIAT
jgi:hypothetical protein|tara:strand:+ start:76105 stop:76698 length:594 start_codon:yes stop_codon:yes gene_type:complete